MKDFLRRIEKKYILSKQQYISLQKALKGKLQQDEFGQSVLCNLYFDTPQYDLIRYSMEKPIYKDKIRIRSYGLPNLHSQVYLEIKRKYDGMVSKRRIPLSLEQAYSFIQTDLEKPKEQIEKELSYYASFYSLKPTMVICYHREAYFEKESDQFRITFDHHLVARDYELYLEKGIYGEPLLEEGQYLMEVKTLSSLPIWFCHLLSELEIYPASFSKYGEAYKKHITKQIEKSA